MVLERVGDALHPRENLRFRHVGLACRRLVDFTYRRRLP